MQELMARAAAKLKGKSRPPNLFNYYRIACGADGQAEALAKSLSALAKVETAYVQGRVTDAGVNATDDVYANTKNHLNEFPADPKDYVYQGYLDKAPYGIDARFAWTRLGGDGEGTNLVAVQHGWLSPSHQDLRDKHVTALWGANDAVSGSVQNLGLAFHATAVLGIACGDDNSVGIVGIAPHVSSVRISSTYWTSNLGRGYYTYGQAIMHAVSKMNAGDILLLPLQVDGPPDDIGTGYVYVPQVPVEYEPDTFDAIKIATIMGIIVVEGAGNGIIVEQNGKPVAPDLTDPNIGGFDIDTLNLGDSGAIIVGAAFAKAVPLNNQSMAPVGHNRADKKDNFGDTLLWGKNNGSGSNYGNRVDCYAWGQNVFAAKPDGYIPEGELPQKTYGIVGGTSAASAIIAGAALCVQGVSQKQQNHTLTPEEMRNILKDPNTGTPQTNVNNKSIGVMPDLQKVITKLVPWINFGPSFPF